jgi:malate dehydrogenase
VDHMHDWHLGTGNRIVSMAIQSTGVYGIPPGVIFSFPVRVDGHGKVHVVEGLEVDDFSRKMLEATHKELLDEWKMSVTFLN